MPFDEEFEQKRASLLNQRYYPVVQFIGAKLFFGRYGNIGRRELNVVGHDCNIIEALPLFPLAYKTLPSSTGCGGGAKSALPY